MRTSRFYFSSFSSLFSHLILYFLFFFLFSFSPLPSSSLSIFLVFCSSLPLCYYSQCLPIFSLSFFLSLFLFFLSSIPPLLLPDFTSLKPLAQGIGGYARREAVGKRKPFSFLFLLYICNLVTIIIIFTIRSFAKVTDNTIIIDMFLGNVVLSSLTKLCISNII